MMHQKELKAIEYLFRRALWNHRDELGEMTYSEILSKLNISGNEDTWMISFTFHGQENKKEIIRTKLGLFNKPGSACQDAIREVIASCCSKNGHKLSIHKRHYLASLFSDSPNVFVALCALIIMFIASLFQKYNPITIYILIMLLCTGFERLLGRNLFVIVIMASYLLIGSLTVTTMMIVAYVVVSFLSPCGFKYWEIFLLISSLLLMLFLCKPQFLPVLSFFGFLSFSLFAFLVFLDLLRTGNHSQTMPLLFTIFSVGIAAKGYVVLGLIGLLTILFLNILFRSFRVIFILKNYG